MGSKIVSLRPLTHKQLEFVRKYCTFVRPRAGRWAFGNATEAVVQTYNVKRRVIAGLMAKQLMKKPHIREAIEQEMKRQDLLSY